MAKNRRKIDPAVQERLGEMAAELRHIIYGEQEYPEWETKFVRIEEHGMGDGFDLVTEFLEQDGDFKKRILEIDYDTYAEGEAELGWLNSSMHITAEENFSLDVLLLDIVTVLKERMKEIEAETAHVKTIGLWEGFFGVANLISSENEPELSLPSNCDVRDVDVIVNARVACDPEILEKLVKETIEQLCKARNAQAAFRKTQSFRPARPVPTHRIESAQ